MTTDEVEAVAARELTELQRRERDYRGDRPPPDLTARTVILVDDGLATGSSMWAALLAARQDDPARIVVAVPVADPGDADVARERQGRHAKTVTSTAAETQTCPCRRGRSPAKHRS